MNRKKCKTILKKTGIGCLLLFLPYCFSVAWVDPTQPPGYASKINNQPLVVTAIFISPKKRLAVINGVFVKVGDTIGGNKVVEIESNTVQLEGDSGRITLHLYAWKRELRKE